MRCRTDNWPPTLVRGVVVRRVSRAGQQHALNMRNACPGLQQAIRENYAHGNAVVEGSSLETLKHMVASGLGITVLPDSAAKEATYGEHTLAVRPFADPTPTRSIALAWRASYPRPEAIDILNDALRGR